MAQDILIIRHAEKPSQAWGDGFDDQGHPDPHSLTSRGWQRTGAWVPLFVSVLSMAPALPTPGRIFASAYKGDDEPGEAESKSKRPQQTMAALSRMLPTVPFDKTLGPGQEVSLAEKLQSADGVSLVCWQHEHILEIVKALAPNLSGLPTKWPGDRYNLVFSLRRDGSQAWSFAQLAPVMLDGDPSATL